MRLGRTEELLRRDEQVRDGLFNLGELLLGLDSRHVSTCGWVWAPSTAGLRTFLGARRDDDP